MEGYICGDGQIGKSSIRRRLIFQKNVNPVSPGGINVFAQRAVHLDLGLMSRSCPSLYNAQRRAPLDVLFISRSSSSRRSGEWPALFNLLVNTDPGCLYTVKKLFSDEGDLRALYI